MVTPSKDKEHVPIILATFSPPTITIWLARLVPPLQTSFRQEKGSKTVSKPKISRTIKSYFSKLQVAQGGQWRKHSWARRTEEIKRRSTLFQIESTSPNLLLTKLPLSTSYSHCPLYLSLILLVLDILLQQSTILSRMPYTQQIHQLVISSNIALQQTLIVTPI